VANTNLCWGVLSTAGISNALGKPLLVSTSVRYRNDLCGQGGSTLWLTTTFW
jgi:hypothetical protein